MVDHMKMKRKIADPTVTSEKKQKHEQKLDNVATGLTGLSHCASPEASQFQPKQSEDKLANSDFFRRGDESSIAVDIHQAQVTFPERLMNLLSSQHEITVKRSLFWLPGGEAFALVPNTFYETVLSKFFQGTKFESFTRKLNRWGFKRLSGYDVPKGTTAYYHQQFKKDRPELLRNIRSGKSSQNQNDMPFGKNPSFHTKEFFVDPVGLVDPSVTLAQQAISYGDNTKFPAEQQGGLNESAGANSSDNINIRLQLLVAHQESQKLALQELLVQDQARARVRAIVQLIESRNSASGIFSDHGQHAELLAFDKARATLAHKALREQLCYRLLHGQDMHVSVDSGTFGAASSSCNLHDELLRLTLLQKQPACRGAFRKCTLS